jgi:hypothetical protein
LTPPTFAGSLTVADIAQAATPSARLALVQPYVEGVWSRWAVLQRAMIAQWYDRFILADHLS